MTLGYVAFSVPDRYIQFSLYLPRVPPLTPVPTLLWATSVEPLANLRQVLKPR